MIRTFSFFLKCVGKSWKLLFFPSFPVQIFLSAPSRAPEFVIVQTSSSTSLIVEWSHLPRDQFRGQPIGYNVTYCPIDSENIVNFVNVNFASNNTILNNLTVYTMYFINVSAVSSGGIGPASPAKARTEAQGTVEP